MTKRPIGRKWTKAGYLAAIRLEIAKCDERYHNDEAWKRPFWVAARTCLVSMDAEIAAKCTPAQVADLPAPWKMMTDKATNLQPKGVRFGQAVMALAEAFDRRATADPMPDNVVELKVEAS